MTCACPVVCGGLGTECALTGKFRCLQPVANELHFRIMKRGRRGMESGAARVEARRGAVRRNAGRGPAQRHAMTSPGAAQRGAAYAALEVAQQGAAQKENNTLVAMPNKPIVHTRDFVANACVANAHIFVRI